MIGRECGRLSFALCGQKFSFPNLSLSLSMGQIFKYTFSQIHFYFLIKSQAGSAKIGRLSIASLHMYLT